MAPVRYGPPGTGAAPAKRSGTRWAVNRAIARKLKKCDCDPVMILARIATDEEAPRELRFRAAARLAVLMHEPQVEKEPPPPPEPEPVDVAAIIEAFWREDDAAKRAQAATGAPAGDGNARPGGDPPDGRGSDPVQPLSESRS